MSSLKESGMILGDNPTASNNFHFNVDSGALTIRKAQTTGQPTGDILFSIGSDGVITTPNNYKEILINLSGLAKPTAVGIPSWAKSITGSLLAQVPSTSPIGFQLATEDGAEIIGYDATYGITNSTGANSTDMFRLTGSTAAGTYRGNFSLEKFTTPDASNMWSYGGNISGYTTSGSVHVSSGTKALAKSLTSLVLTSVSGTQLYTSGYLLLKIRG